MDSQPFLGLRTAIYTVNDLEKAIRARRRAHRES